MSVNLLSRHHAVNIFAAVAERQTRRAWPPEVAGSNPVGPIQLGFSIGVRYISRFPSADSIAATVRSPSFIFRVFHRKS
jgi:hypothetical protein